MANYTTDDARDALGALDPGVSHAEWVRIGMAAHAAGLSVEDWIEWSSRSDAFSGDKECRVKWRSFRPGDVTAGTLYFLAREAGWEPRRDSGHDDHVRRPPPARAADSKGPQRQARRATEPSPEKIAERLARLKQLLEAARPASEFHPYLVRKQESAEGLLEIDLADLVRILGYHPEGKHEPLQGREILLAPMHDGSGEARQVEMIDGQGTKVALALPRGGLMWTPRHLASTDATIGICEGLATAKTLMRLRKHLVVAAGTAVNLPKVAERLRELCPRAELIVYADLGTDGQEYAKRAADTVMGLMVSPPAEIFEEPNGKDFNDAAWYMDAGELAEYLNARSVHPQRITFAQASSLIHIDYVLPSLPVGAVGLLVGQGSIGKSFLALELAMSVTLGRNLPGLPGQFENLKYGRTAMVFGEDDRAIINNRMHHLAVQFRLTGGDLQLLDDSMHVLSLVGEDMRIAEVDMRSVREGPFIARLRNICLGRRLVFIDPLIRLHDADENDNTAASHLMLSVQRIARDTGCSIILLHHVGKGQQDGWAAARGASAITTTARWQMNLMPPSKEEREKLGIDDDDARQWVKCDGVKMNYGENLRHFWVRRGPHGILLHDEPVYGSAGAPAESDPFARSRASGGTRPPPGRR